MGQEGGIEIVGGRGINRGVFRLLFLYLAFSVFLFPVFADLGPGNVLLLVNENSPTSRYIAKLYREYYPAIEDNQVLLLSSLADCSGPTSTAADEIITRQQYDTCIAEPVRQHLINHDLLEQIMVIVTTAGMPYRIEDTVYGAVIGPASSSASTVAAHLGVINAASVESELTCLWYTSECGIANRVVNPYQGYRNSSITLFERVPPGTKLMHWIPAVVTFGEPPIIEGYQDNTTDIFGFPVINCWGAYDRSFGPGDIYLTCRLDGAKYQGRSAVFAVRQMLERSRRAGELGPGVDPLRTAMVLDDAINPIFGDDCGRIYDLDASVNYVVFDAGQPQPPDARHILIKDDYVECYTSMTNDAYSGTDLNVGFMSEARNLCVLLDRREDVRTCHTDLDDLVSGGMLQEPAGLLGLACYGKNGDEGSAKDYLLSGGAGGGPLFKPVNGAVFTSIESFNGLTMFSDASTTQAKIIDFIDIGGSGAIGHAFEPVDDAIIDNLYYFYNYVVDANGDEKGDLTFVEAAFTGIPYLSWSEVVIGDPLMRIHYGPGEEEAWSPLLGDVDDNNRVDYWDMFLVKYHFGGTINAGVENAMFAKYNDKADFDKNGTIDYWDLLIVKQRFGDIR